MCITWEVIFTKCSHTKATNVHLYCYKYRRTRKCEGGEVRQICKTSFCDECKVWKEGAGFDGLARKTTDIKEGGVQWHEGHGRGEVEKPLGDGKL
jgi:hypothetical protein